MQAEVSDISVANLDKSSCKLNYQLQFSGREEENQLTLPRQSQFVGNTRCQYSIREKTLNAGMDTQILHATPIFLCAFHLLLMPTTPCVTHNHLYACCLWIFVTFI